MAFTLRLLGGTSLLEDGRPVSGPAGQRHRLALLARLAAACPRGVARESLMALLWPESDDGRARRLLNQAVHVVRRNLGEATIARTGDELRLDASVLACDLVAWSEAVAAGDHEAVFSRYTGPFLEGFHLDTAPEFERWVEGERTRIAGVVVASLRTLAGAAADDPQGAARWWERCAALEPFDTEIARRTIEALAHADRRPAALLHAREFRRRLRAELDVEADPVIVALDESLRTPPSPPAGTGVEPSLAPPFTSEDLARTTPSRRRRTVVLLVGALAATLLLWVSDVGNTSLGSPAPVGTSSIAALDLYRQASDPSLLRSDTTVQRGIEQLRLAVSIDPGFGAAWATLGRLLLRPGNASTAEKARSRREGEDAIARALVVDDRNAEAHAILGLARAMRFDLDEGGRHIERARGLAPDVAFIHEMATNFYLLAERPDLALAAGERAAAVEPLSATASAQVAIALAASDRCEESLARVATLTNLRPPMLRVAPVAAYCLGRIGQWDSAATVLRPQATAGDPLATAMLGQSLMRGGHREDAERIQASLLARHANGEVGAYYLAFVPAARGAPDEAFDWLERAVDDGSLGITIFARFGLLPLSLRELEGHARMARLRELVRAVGAAEAVAVQR